MEARYRTDYLGEFVVTKTTWGKGQRTQEREWIANPITNQHISGRAACIASNVDREQFDYTILERHRGGLLGSLKLQTYGVAAIANDMRLDFTVDLDINQLTPLIENKYVETNIVYTTARNCLYHPGEFYLIPMAPHLSTPALPLYLAAFDGHKEIFMIGYNKDTGYGNNRWVAEVEDVIKSYPGVQFTCVGNSNNMYDCWFDYGNLRSLNHYDFIGYCDI